MHKVKCDKNSYENLGIALVIIDQLKQKYPNINLSAYQCKKCFNYHLTSSSDEYIDFDMSDEASYFEQKFGLKL